MNIDKLKQEISKRKKELRPLVDEYHRLELADIELAKLNKKPAKRKKNVARKQPTKQPATMSVKPGRSRQEQEGTKS